MYEIETEYTFNDEKKLMLNLLKNRLLRVIIILLLDGLIFLGFATNSFIYYLYFCAITLVCMMPIVIIFYMKIIKIKKKYSSNQSIIKRYTFLNNYLEEWCENDKRYIYYHDIIRLIKTKKTIYIVTSKYNGIIIKKEDCSDELLEFITTI